MRCVHCFRPRCICASIPSIKNETAILILQHRRERFHRFNSARLVQRALENSQLVAGYPCDFTLDRLRLMSDVGVLFPSQHARNLEDLSPAERPQQLVILDGTWHHAKTFVRDIPWLSQICLLYTSPSPRDATLSRMPSSA